MKRYQSHKIVEAGVIAQVCEASIENEKPFVLLRDGTTVFVPSDFLARGAPQFGDYVVRYDGDYLSWSPKDKFEAGYAEVGEAATTKPVQLDIAKALRDAYGRGYAHCGRQAGEEPQGLNAYNDERDAWIAQYMARLPGVELVAQTGMAAGDWSKLMGKEQTQVDDVTVTVSAPPGKRARVVTLRLNGNSITQTIAGGQSHQFKLEEYETIKIELGEPHSTVAHQGE